MFGGPEIWESGDVFAFISSDSELYLKVDESTRPAYEAAACHQFRAMSYQSVPDYALDGRGAFRKLASEAMAVGHRATRKKQ